MISRWLAAVASWVIATQDRGPLRWDRDPCVVAGATFEVRDQNPFTVRLTVELAGRRIVEAVLGRAGSGTGTARVPFPASCAGQPVEVRLSRGKRSATLYTVVIPP